MPVANFRVLSIENEVILLIGASVGLGNVRDICQCDGRCRIIWQINYC